MDVLTAPDDPLTFNLGTFQIESGTIELHGAGGSVVEVRRDPSALGSFVLTLDGEPYERTLDCSDAVYPFVQGGLALLAELPVY